MTSASTVEVVASMGSDDLISKIAGISHDSEKGPPVRDLIRWGHETPLEFGQIIFKITCPIFVFRHIVRHRTFTFVERSGRYTDSADSGFFLPPVLRTNGPTAMPRIVEAQLRKLIVKTLDNCVYLYRALIAAGVPKELARIFLPLSLMTEVYARIDLRNLRSFFKLRLHSTAQLETRQVAAAMFDEAYKLFPESFADLLPARLGTEKP